MPSPQGTLCGRPSSETTQPPLLDLGGCPARTIAETLASALTTRLPGSILGPRTREIPAPGEDHIAAP
ncbi:hypothetical protein ACQYWQ_27665 [Streptomyces sp. P6-2-1]|uniref:hypothetical protein n=1 Tax=Streptomyces sp. P6-2-1 TaxID=3422591 RepID=UPI003D3605B0